MVKEELFIIVDGERKQLDLSSPSGITLNFVSNLFNDLSKINASYSYTFKLPRTVNNCRVLELADDVRSDSRMSKVKNPAEFTYDGVSLFMGANLYISSVESDYINAVMTWGVNKGLQELSDRDMSLRELGNHLPEGEYDYKGDEDSEFETDRVVRIGSNFTETENYDPTKPAFRSLHNGGVKLYNQGEPYFIHSSPSSIARDYLAPPPPIFTDEEYPEGCAEEYNKEFNYRQTYAYPAPIVPVPYIMNVISKVFGLNFDLSGELYESLCVPLVKNEVSDALARVNYVNVSFTDTRHEGFLCLDCNVVNNYPNLNQLSTNVVYYDFGIPTAYPEEHTLAEFSLIGVDYQTTEVKYRVGGELKIVYNNFPSHYDYPSDTLNLIFYSVGYEDKERVQMSDLHEIGRVAAYQSGYEMGQHAMVYTARFNMNEKDGFELLETEAVYRPSLVVRLAFTDKDGKDYFIQDIDHCIDFIGSLHLYVVPTNYVHGACVNVFQNLPDISCMEFVKSIFYALGGYPFQSSTDDIIGLQQYSTIINKIRKNEINDWSHKIINPSGTDKDNFIYQTEDVTGLSLCKKNYFLMKNDEVDDFGKEQQNSKKETAYEHGYLSVDVEDDLLENTQTLFTFPFYGMYLWEKGFYKPLHYQEEYYDRVNFMTGGGQDIWQIVAFGRYSVIYIPIIIPIRLVDIGGRYKCQEAKPMLGVVTSVDVPVCNMIPDNSSSINQLKPEPTGEYKHYVSMRVWNCAKDMVQDASFGVLQDVFGRPCLVKEELMLNTVDLTTLDMETPVYIEKYNSMFAIKSVEVSSDGNCTCELLKIPVTALTKPINNI